MAPPTTRYINASCGWASLSIGMGAVSDCRNSDITIAPIPSPTSPSSAMNSPA